MYMYTCTHVHEFAQIILHARKILPKLSEVLKHSSLQPGREQMAVLSPNPFVLAQRLHFSTGSL